MKSRVVKHDFSQLDKFVKGLAPDMVVRVGIFGNKNNRADMDKPIKHGTAGSIRLRDRSYQQHQTETNAEIGFKHEFGKGVPMRSFLRMPIFQYAEDILLQVKKAGALKKIAAGRVIAVLADLGVACEATVLSAFESGGWGHWKANSPATIRAKKSSSPLIDTGQLRRSISSAVVNK